MSGFTLRQLEIFAQVVEHGSFRRCAEHLGVSQVSVSEHMRELENRLGATLFDRNAGGPATLTRTGGRAYRRVSAILADLNDLSWDISGGLEGGRRRLVVGLYPYLMRHVRDALAEFKGLHPEVEITIDFELATPAHLYQRIQNRELDVAYFIGFDGQEVASSELVRLEPLAVYVSRTHPLANREGVTSAEIRATPAIHLASRNPMRLAVDRALEQAGAAGSPVGVEVDEYELILTSVARGDGFVCMFEANASDVAISPGIVPLRMERPLPALQVRQITRHSVNHDPTVRALVETLGRALKAPGAPSARYER